MARAGVAKKKTMPLGRLGSTGDAGAMVAWLASDEAAFTVGAAFNLTALTGQFGSGFQAITVIRCGGPSADQRNKLLEMAHSELQCR
jgi:NAD(P)-dependent dehydrogenase (short-subunit alcohol dehydrogenase family)